MTGFIPLRGVRLSNLIFLTLWSLQPFQNFTDYYRDVILAFLSKNSPAPHSKLCRTCE